MTPALLESPLPLFGESRRPDRAGGRGGLTLEERLTRTLRAVQTDAVAECPVCRSAMRPEGATGRCTGCWSTLA
jgi:hypothetical protein